MPVIKLTNGGETLVDDSDYEHLSQWNWQQNQGYAIRNQYVSCINGKRKNKTIYMHRAVNKTPDGMETDHINNDKLDNRKTNLRASNRSNNAVNKPKQSNNTSGYKGVGWHKVAGKWRATIKVNNRAKHLGHFATPEDAATAYNFAALEYFGKFATFNDARAS